MAFCFSMDKIPVDPETCTVETGWLALSWGLWVNAHHDTTDPSKIHGLYLLDVYHTRAAYILDFPSSLSSASPKGLIGDRANPNDSWKPCHNPMRDVLRQFFAFPNTLINRSTLCRYLTTSPKRHCHMSFPTYPKEKKSGVQKKQWKVSLWTNTKLKERSRCREHVC